MHLKEQYLCDICRFDCQYKKNDTDKNKDCGYCVPILEYVFSINKETLDHTLQILNDITTANHPNRIYSNLESNQPHDQPIKKYFNQFQTINQLKDFFTDEIK